MTKNSWQSSLKFGVGPWLKICPQAFPWGPLNAQQHNPNGSPELKLYSVLFKFGSFGFCELHIAVP
jgi:hypothetical protein